MKVFAAALAVLVLAGCGDARLSRAEFEQRLNHDLAQVRGMQAAVFGGVATNAKFLHAARTLRAVRLDLAARRPPPDAEDDAKAIERTWQLFECMFAAFHKSTAVPCGNPNRVIADYRRAILDLRRKGYRIRS